MNVLIVPLFPRQFEWLKQTYQGPHVIEYLDSAKGESPRVLEDKAKRADKVVVLTKFISHSHWDKVPREKLIHSDSVNMDRLVNILETIPADTVSTQPAPPDTAPKLVKPRAQIIRRAEMSTSTTRTVEGFEDLVLTTAVPLPEAKPNIPKRKAAWPLEHMKVGESFWVPTKTKEEQRKVASRISVAANYQRKKNPKLCFVTSVKQEGGVRCWRAPDRDPKDETDPRRRPRKSRKPAVKK